MTPRGPFQSQPFWDSMIDFLNSVILISLWSLKKGAVFTLFCIPVSAMENKKTVIQLSGTFTGDALPCAMVLKVKLVCAYCVFIEFV